MSFCTSHHSEKKETSGYANEYKKRDYIAF
jgi:hypothetical protein